MTEIVIDRLGRDGDGIAGGTYLPFTLPGERVRPGDPPEILTPSPERVAPPCRHFGACGGCALQHASDRYLATWKQEVVQRALDARGLSAPFRPIAVSPKGSRRRASFTVRRTKKSVQMGFMARGSDRVEDLSECHLVKPGMLALRDVCAGLARIGASRKGALKVQVTDSAAGWDLAVTGGKPLDGPMRAALAGEAASAGLARLSWDGDIVVMARPPAQTMGRAQVVPPPGGFLQATLEGEAALVAAVRDAIGPSRTIVDLFAGCGTFSLPLAETAEVLAVEGEAEMLAALDAGWRGASGLKRITHETRDLFRRPLEPLELRAIDAAIIDPPRAGAEAQVARLAQSEIPLIAMVSCNPVTFARDAAALVASGFQLDWAQVVDQFRWSGHVELIARFSR